MSKWNGEGLPPVGEVVEMFDWRQTQDWLSVEIVAHHKRLGAVGIDVDDGFYLSTDHPGYIRPLKSEAEDGGQKYPEVEDKFYEALGWMHAECCSALDRGEDPRKAEIGDMVKRCIHDLTVGSEADRNRDEAVEEMFSDIYSAELASFEWNAHAERICRQLHDAGYRKVTPLTDEQIDDLCYTYRTYNKQGWMTDDARNIIDAVQRIMAGGES